MKKIFLSLIASLVFFGISFGQEKLKVVYESYNIIHLDKVETEVESFSMSSGSVKIDQKEMSRMLEDSMKKPTFYELILNSDESTFIKQDKINNQQGENAFGISISMGGPSEILYKNLKENSKIKTVNSFGKDFLIIDSLHTYDWKISKESKEILGYEVRKATYEKNSENGDILVNAWYAPKLPYKNGPKSYQGLPGLILEVEYIIYNEGEESYKQTFEAISLEVDKDKDPIKKPNKGKKVTEKELQEIQKDQMEKMREMWGGGIDKD